MKWALGLLVAVLAAFLCWWSPSRAGTNNGGGAPPTTDFHTVVTQPGHAGGGSADAPPEPVCLWQRGGTTEVNAIAKTSGVSAAIIKETAEDHILLVYRCDGRWDGRTWRWVVPVTASELAHDGLVELSGRLPAPAPITMPAAGVASIAKVPVFVWTDAAAWAPLEVTRTDPLTGLSATAVAIPATMTFDPGDGTAPVRCDGPGVAYDPGLDGGDPGPQAAAAGRCAHAYERITRNTDGSAVAGRPAAWSATLTVGWAVAWTATNGQSGQFPPIKKSTSFERPVTEVQVLVTG